MYGKKHVEYNNAHPKINEFDSLVLELITIPNSTPSTPIEDLISFFIRNFSVSAGIICVLNTDAIKSQKVVHSFDADVVSDIIAIENHLQLKSEATGTVDLNKMKPSANFTFFNRDEHPKKLAFIRSEFQLKAGSTASFTLLAVNKTTFEKELNLQRLFKIACVTLKHHLENQQFSSALYQELALYKNLASNTHDMICMHEPSGVYTFVSESVKQILGYEPIELLGTSPYELFHLEDLEHILKKSHEPAINGERYENMEYRIRRKDGNFIWFNTSTQPILDELGEVIALQTTSRNIDSKKRQEMLFVETQKMTKTGGWVLDLQSMDFYGTDYTYEIHDLDPALPIDLKQAITFFPEDGSRKIVVEAVDNCIHKNKAFDLTLPFISATNQHKYVRVKGKALTHNGQAYKMVGTFQDVSEHVKLDTLFKESQKLAAIGGWEYHIWNGDLFITDGVCDIFEIEYNSKLHFEELLLYFPNDGPRKKVKEIVTRAMQTGKKQEVHLPAISSTGKHKYVHAILKPVIVENNLVKIVSTFQDVTEKTKIEYFLRDTQDVANVGGWDYYVASDDLYWSEEMYTIHELGSGTKLTADHLTMFFTGKSVNRIQNALKESLITGKPYEIESKLVTAKGTVKYVRIIGKPMSSNGQVFRIYGTYQDITESKRYIQMISDQNLQLAKEKETRDKLYSILAHDLRNSMSGVNALLGMVIDNIEKEKFDVLETTEHLRLVLNSSISGIKLLENIQGWIKLQSGELTTMPDNFDLTSRVKACLELLNPMVKSKKITIKSNLPTKTNVFADPEMITTIIRNLINNAIKYSYSESSIEILIEADSKEDYQKVIIKDHGIGMPESVKQNLFNQQNRPQREGTANEAGTGLGLLLTNELVNMNNCKLSVESEPDKGSVFTVFIPNCT